MAEHWNDASWGTTALWVSGFFALLMAGSIAIGVVMEKAHQAKGHTIFAVKLKRHQARRERIGNLIFFAVWVPIAIVVLRLGWVRFTSGLFAEWLTFGVCWVSFMVYFWLIHRAMHSRALFWTHRWHHESLVTTPWTGFSLGPAESLGWAIGFVWPAIVLTYFDVLGLWGYLGFLAMLFYGNITGHANAELMPGFLARMNWLGNPVVFHSLHHARFEGHYGFASGWMDTLCGTEMSDWKAVHAQVMRGEPLRSLRQKGAESAEVGA
ncbi:MAG: sterol desaturase family protein [Sandaracinus sp.]|nr:sterol desaturase family protein [Sandaracinus sp.]MCB9636609.1 sterol desaturase family protein [Sandaracinus sp.]